MTFQPGIWLTVLALLTVSSLGLGQTSSRPDPKLSDWDCAICHGGDAPDIPVATGTSLDHSVHQDFDCLDCHTDVQEIPHQDELAPADCSLCHEEAARTYTGHGRGLIGVTEDLPGCADCHGSHQILPSTDPDSRVHPRNMESTCSSCHSNLDLAKKHDIKLKRPVESYHSSVHEEPEAGKDTPSAVCTDCHATEGSAHHILSSGNPLSSVNHFNTPATCGQCHDEIKEAYLAGIHGQMVTQGDSHSPVCTDCHGEHGILRTKDPRSNVSPVMIAEATCTPCHESARMNDIFGIPAGELASFVDSYHGLKSRAGDTHVANCASCHGSHKILPSHHPESTIHPANLQQTCGSCHPGITAEFAQTPIHANGVGGAGRWPRLIARIYVVLLVVVIGGMFVFIVLDFRTHVTKMVRKPQVQRMDRNALFQHTVIMVSFTLLVVTGFALRYSEVWIFKQAFGWDGGAGARGVIHRTLGVVFILSVFWHLFYLRTPRGREFWRGILPARKDFKQLGQTLLFFVGRRSEGPRFDRFSFVEKVEYWALVWGTAIMVFTGLLIWFDALALRLFTKVFLDVMRVIHFYEAWLAALAILLWHMYSTVYKPGVYPGNPSWVTGTMPREMYKEEHSGDPGIQGEPNCSRTTPSR